MENSIAETNRGDLVTGRGRVPAGPCWDTGEGLYAGPILPLRTPRYTNTSPEAAERRALLDAIGERRGMGERARLRERPIGVLRVFARANG